MLPTGYILPSERTPEQQQAHAAAVASMPRFGIAGAGVKTTSGSSTLDVNLYKACQHPKVIDDIGFMFYRWHQQTGSCVGAGLGQVLVILSAVQRLFASNPTKAALWFWLFNYGRSRYLYGWKNPGEGSFGSTAAKSVRDEGVVPIAGTPNLPAFRNAGEDGLIYDARIEMAYSDGDTRENLALMSVAKQYPVGQVAELTSVEQIAEAIANGYPCTFASSGNCQNASIQGSGENACVVGRNNSRGGHQWAIVAVWDHPTLGRLFGNLNNWPSSVYRRDPRTKIPCFYWTTEDETARSLRNEGECFAFSNLRYFPAQPDVSVPWLI